MDKEYKIQPDKIETMTSDELKRMGVIVFSILIFVSIFPSIAVFQEHEPIYLVVVPAIFCIVILGCLLLYISKFKRLYWENYRINITDNGVR